MALFYYKEKKNKGIRAAAYLRLSIEDGDKAESNSIGRGSSSVGTQCTATVKMNRTKIDWW